MNTTPRTTVHAAGTPGRYDDRIRAPHRARRVTPDELERLAFEHPGAQIEFGDTDAMLTLAGTTYVAEFDIRTAVA